MFGNDFFPRLNTTGQDYNVLNLNICTSDTKDIISSTYNGNFDIDNERLMKPLDEILHQRFAAELASANKSCPHIYNACSAGAYLKVFCSGSFEGHAEIISDDLMDLEIEENVQLHLEAHIGYLLLCKAARLGKDILSAMHIPESDNSPFAYAGGVIIFNEFNYFADALLHKTMFDQITQPTRKILGNWLASVVEELKDHMSEGCARYPEWRSVIDGSLKKLRRVESQLDVTIHLQQYKVPPTQDTWSSFTAYGLDNWTNSDQHPVFPGDMWPNLGNDTWGYILNSTEVPSTRVNTPDPLSPNAFTPEKITQADDKFPQATTSQSEPPTQFNESMEFDYCIDPSRLSREDTLVNSPAEDHFQSPPPMVYDNTFQLTPRPAFSHDLNNSLLREPSCDGFTNHDSGFVPESYRGSNLDDKPMIQDYASIEHYELSAPKPYGPLIHDRAITMITPRSSPSDIHILSDPETKAQTEPRHPTTTFPFLNSSFDSSFNFHFHVSQTRPHPYTSL
ncbi:hypothetical protein NHQ30_008966 [Ciborinia camelliae]|nr:hypothetical protein NHQ30_008966 [Ciborinia camelliae]